ncbi:MAG: sugar ABC transporter permease [Treponema sp.]|jgi:raffinose/stachyose/melibiose transport system permease protein|nr:sugar ABC transporter permease [Treponema sp.]
MYEERGVKKRLRIFLTFGFPPLAVFALVVLVPFVFGIFVTFTNWSGTQSTVEFLGLQNYVQAFTDPQLWTSLGITFKYAVWVLVLTNIIALGLALLVTSGVKGQNGFRAAFFTPNLMGGVILGFIWLFIFSRVFVYIGRTLDIHLFSESWIGDSQKALWALIVVAVWQMSGYMMLIYIAGLIGIPRSVTEAAVIDGATGWQILSKIKIPMMVPSFTISLFLTLQKAFMIYDTNLSLTHGGPYNSTQLAAMHIYDEAFKLRNYGPGQAKAILFFIIVAGLALLQVVLLKKREVEALS